MVSPQPLCCRPAGSPLRLRNDDRLTCQQAGTTPQSVANISTRGQMSTCCAACAHIFMLEFPRTPLLSTRVNSGCRYHERGIGSENATLGGGMEDPLYAD